MAIQVGRSFEAELDAGVGAGVDVGARWRRLGSFVVLALVATVLAPLSVAYAQSQNEVLVSVLYDGTETGNTGAFDTDPGGSVTATGVVPEPHTPGLDAGPQNLVVKTYDTYAIRVDWNINEDAAEGVVLTVTLPGHSQWEPDATGMVAGCDPALSSFVNAQTLECHLGDQPEGSNGAIRPVASIGFENDSETFDVTAVLTTAADATGVTDGLDQLLTVSEAPVADWIKGEPMSYGPFDHNGTEGYIGVFPIGLIDYSVNGPAMTGMGPINDAVAIDINDHAWGFPASAEFATAAHMTSAGISRNACGLFDDASSAEWPVTVGSWTCGTPNTTPGYPFRTLTVTGHDTLNYPATMADGVTPNEGIERLFNDGEKRKGVFVVTGQVAMWVSAADVQTGLDDADNVSNGSAVFWNALTPQDENTTITDEADVAPDLIAGSTGTTPEIATTGGNPPANNTRGMFFGTAVTSASPGSSIGHDIKWLRGPLQLIETGFFGSPRVGFDMRWVADGGLGVLPGSWEGWHAYSWDGAPIVDRTGTTPRGATLTLEGQVLTNSSASTSLWDAPISGCFAFDPAHYELSALPTAIPVTQTSGSTDRNPPVTGSYTVAPNAGPLAHVVTGEGWSANDSRGGQLEALGGDRGPYAFTVEFTDAPVHYHSGASFGVEHDGLTCDNADAGPSGWIDANDAAALVTAFDSNGDGNYEGITKARVRITERFSWARFDDDATKSKHGFKIWFEATVKSDVMINNNNSELMALASHTFGDVDPVTGASDMVPYIGHPATHCSPYGQRSWTRIAGPTPVTDPSAWNDLATTTGWCNHQYKDDGVDSFDETDLEDWDNGSGNMGVSDPGPVPRQRDGWYNASGAMIYIVGAELGLVKENVDGLTDVKDNGELVQFRIRPSVIGSPLEALTNVVLTDPLPANYQFVRFVSQPATGPGCTESGGTVTCQFSEPVPASDSDPLLPAGLPGGWEDEFIIEVRVVNAIANPTYPTQITNTATIRSSGLGPWDDVNEEFAGTIGVAAKSKANSASSYMPLPADEGAILKNVDTLDGACDAHPTVDPMPAGWDGRCSKIGHDDDMSFVLSLTNEGNTEFTNIQVIDVFPHNADAVEPASGTNIQGGSPSTLGDGRDPESDFTGTLGFVSVTDVANGTGVVTLVTGDAPLTVSRDPLVSVDGAAPNTWCTAPGGTVVIGSGTCPATAEDVTASYSNVPGPLAPGSTLELRLTLDSEDSTCGDHWTNTFGARVDQILLPIRSNDVSVMVECEFDLALTKVIDPSWTPGADWITEGTTTVPFVIEVTNQGDPVEDFDITDYVDTNVWSFDVANNADGTTTGTGTGAGLPFSWDVTDPTKPVASVDGRFDDGDTLQIPVVLTIEDITAGDLVNTAEISYFDADGDPSNGDSDPSNANNPSSGALTDVDSTPDDTDGGVDGEDPDVNMVDNDTTGDALDTDAPGDEDDHDSALVPIFDLELVKVAATPAMDWSVTPPTATFEITVTNQGNSDVHHVAVTEYAPAGLTYDPAATAAAWTAAGTTGVVDNNPTFDIAGPIPAGGDVSFALVYQMTDLSQAPFTNAAEISAFDDNADVSDTPGPLVVDVDSTPDAVNDDDVDDQFAANNDPDDDGNVNEATAGDEDDHDIAVVSPYDLALTKTFVAMDSPLLPGGTVTMNLTVTNQAAPVETIDITDHLDPALWAPFDASLNPDGPVDATSTAAAAFNVAWDASDPANPVAQVTPVTAGDTVGYNETVVIPITVQVAAGFTSADGPLVNTAEVSNFDNDSDPGNGDASDGTIADHDSTTDGIDGNSPGEDPDADATDDDISGDSNAGGDEDNHDWVTIPIMDLALRKTLDPTTVFPVLQGDQVTFLIEIINQGNVDVTDPTVIDYVDPALWDAFDVAVNPAGASTGSVTLPYAWAANVNGQDGDLTITGTLAPGDSIIVPVTLTVAAAADLEALANTAELTGGTATEDDDGDPNTPPVTVTNPDGSPVVDADSTADDTNDDPLVDDVTDGTDGDEDDHDTALVEPPTYSLGGQIINDANNDGTNATDGSEGPVEGVVVHLFTDADGDGLPDDLDGDGIIDANDAIATTTTGPDGEYNFDDLPAGDYVVGIAPENFDPGGALEGWMPADTASADADDDVDGVNDGTACGCPDGYVFTTPVTLDDTEPTGETGPEVDPNNADSLSNSTVDFGFWQPIFDLALTKTVADGQATSVTVGDDVTYTISVINQGGTEAIDIEIVDYLPAGMTLNDTDWTMNGGNAVTTIAGPIAAGDTVTVDITVTITAAGSLDNHAEIAEATPSVGGAALIMPNGDPVPDTDSTADTTNDDGLTDDATDGTGGDEDDHDVAGITATNPPAPPSAIAFTGRETNTGLGIGISLLWMGLLILAAETWTRRRQTT